jgi:hypothetical protein
MVQNAVVLIAVVRPVMTALLDDCTIRGRTRLPGSVLRMHSPPGSVTFFTSMSHE